MAPNDSELSAREWFPDWPEATILIGLILLFYFIAFQTIDTNQHKHAPGDTTYPSSKIRTQQ